MTRQPLSLATADDGLLAGLVDLSLLNHSRQTGGNVLWSYRISQRRANLNLAIQGSLFGPIDTTISC